MPAAPAARRLTIASDGWRLAADLQLPPRAARAAPVAILLNGAGRDRGAYVALAAELARRGVASLRVDLRGWGESTNLGRIVPGQPAPAATADAHRDVVAATRALAALAARGEVDTSRVAIVGASFSGEAMARAGRTSAWAQAYVALSPGSLGDTSARAIPGSGARWLFVRSDSERFVREWLDTLVTTHAPRATMRVVAAGAAHGTDILDRSPATVRHVAEWIAAALAESPRAWAGLEAGPFAVGYQRWSPPALAGPALDVWYPAARGDARPLAIADYVRLALPGGERLPTDSLRRALATGLSAQPATLDDVRLDSLLALPMAARRDAPSIAGRRPLVAWSPRHATTLAQAPLSEWLASHGWIVASPVAPEPPIPMPFESGTGASRRAALDAQATLLVRTLDAMRGHPSVDASRVAVLAWSYGGEAATHVAARRPDVRLVVGLSTNVLGGSAYLPDDSLLALPLARGRTAWVVFAEGRDRRGNATRPPRAIDSVAGRWAVVRFGGLAHGSFNALEGAWPAWLGGIAPHPWSTHDADATGWRAIARATRAALEALAAAGQATPPCLARVRWREALREEDVVSAGDSSGDRDGRACQAAARRGSTTNTPAAATSARTLPMAKAVGAPKRVHTMPKSTDAGSAARPIARLYQPNAVPRRSAGTRSATSAFSAPSTSPKCTPYSANSAHACQATPARAKPR
jgi:dienelactone hydrolase